MEARVAWDIGGSVPTMMFSLIVMHCFQDQRIDSFKEISVLGHLIAFVNYYMNLWLEKPK